MRIFDADNSAASCTYTIPPRWHVVWDLPEVDTLDEEGHVRRVTVATAEVFEQVMDTSRKKPRQVSHSHGDDFPIALDIVIERIPTP